MTVYQSPDTANFTTPGGSTQALLDALRIRLADALQGLLLETDVQGEAHRAPRIYDGFLPPKRGRGSQEGEFPFVLVRPLMGVDKVQGEAQVQVRLVIGTHSEAPDGYRTWLAVAERIRGDLMAAPTLASRFRAELPLEWDLPEDQQQPQWLGAMQLTFTVPAVRNLEGRDFL